MPALASPPPVLLAFNLFDSRAEWPEIALVISGALVGAALVSRVMGRILTWASQGAIGAHVPEAYQKAARRPLFVVRFLVFVLTWILLALPLLDALGLPLDLGTNRRAVRQWLLGSGVRAGRSPRRW